MRPAASPLETPENLWHALTYSRSYRIGMLKAEQDAKDGTISLVNEDAL